MTVKKEKREKEKRSNDGITDLRKKLMDGEKEKRKRDQMMKLQI